jgi:type I restriction enzyme S subunit
MNELKGDLPEGFKMTELGPLPEEWEVVKLGDVAEVSSGGSAPQGDEYFNGSKPFVRVSHIDNEDYTIKRYDLISDKAIQDYRLKLFPKGTIVFPKSGATIYLEKRAMLPIDAYVVSHLCTVLSKREDLSQCFLFYVLRNLKFAKEKADGYPTLNISEIKQILIPLPPLPEQRKIAAVLSAVQEAKEKTEVVINAARDLKKSMMSYLFTYGPVSLPEAENVLLKETEVGMIPEEWEVVKLGDVAEVSSGGSAPQGDEYFNGSKPFVRVSHIDNEDYTIKRYDLISDKAIQDYRLKLFPKGTIVFPKSGATIYLEKRAMLPIDAYVVSHLCTVLSKREDLSQCFLFYVLRNLKFAKEKADGYPTLNISEIKQILIPLPPLPVQQKIASILSAIDQKIEAEEDKKKALEDLFKTLLHNLMTAKIRVNNLEVGA